MQRSPIRWLPRRILGVALAALLVPAAALAQGNGRLQIHHINVGQGDGMLVISPNGETALFDDGVYTNCTPVVSYLQGLGLTSVKYHFTSHYHADHIGCIDDLAAVNITVAVAGWDRGYSYSSATYTNYVNTLGSKRRTLVKGQVILLDSLAAVPVRITCVDLNGAGVYSPTGSDENAKSAVYKVSWGAFDEVIGGDLTGDGSTDVESTIGPMVGDVEVYKVHHHGSRYSTNDNWLVATTPEVAIIQVGSSNTYGHPTADALGRMHARGVKTYWTTGGAGASPNPTWDTVANGTIIVDANDAVGETYTVSGPGFSHNYTIGGGAPPVTLTETLVATSMTMIKGSITTGDVTRLAADDAVRVSVGAGITSGKYLTDWYGSVTLNHPPTKLTITYDGNYTVSRTQTLYLWNWSTSAWVQIDQATVSTSDVKRTYVTTSPANYVSGTREVRLRVATNNRNSSFTCRGDYMAFTYDYLQGTAPAAIASLPREEAPQPAPVAGEAGAELPLATLTRVESRAGWSGTTLLWAVDRGAHVDGFNVYREDASGARTFVGNEAMVGLTGAEAEFRFVDRSGERDAVYWLGARGCSGPEAVIGPIRVSPAAFEGATLAFALEANPVRGAARMQLALPERGEVTLEVFDVTGRRTATVFHGVLDAGTTSLVWDRRTEAGAVAGPGVYFARVQAAGGTRLARLTLLGD